MPNEEKNWEVKMGMKDGKQGFLTCRDDIKVFSNRNDYPWLLMVCIEINGVRDDGLTSSDDAKILNNFEDILELNFARLVKVIFVGRTTWNGWRDLYFYINDPEPIHAYLSQVIAIKDYPKKFEYRIEKDEEWEKAIEIFDPN